MSWESCNNKDSSTAGQGWGLDSACLSNQIPGDANMAGPETTV